MAMTAGYLDGYGLFHLKIFVSFMSGNTTSAGVKTGQGQFLAVVPILIAVFCFLAAAFSAICYLNPRFPIRLRRQDPL